MRAYSYIRFSSAGQLGNDSLRRQTELAENWAAQRPRQEQAGPAPARD